MANLPVIASCWNDNELDHGKPGSQSLQFVFEDDVLFSSHAIKDDGFGIQTEVINVTQDRKDRSDAAAAGEQDYRLVFIRVEAELAKRSPCLHRQAHRGL